MTILKCWAQGPPIILDKPLLLGGGKGTFRANYLYRSTPLVNIHSTLLRYDYNITAKWQAGIRLPVGVANTRLAENPAQDQSGIGDITVQGKYNFYAKNAVGKTFRTAAKVETVFPTGKTDNIPLTGIGAYQVYTGGLAAIETIKYGIQSELGYRVRTDGRPDAIEYKLGFALPLLKPKYPVKQFNIYFEYEGFTFSANGNTAIFYSQGFQYAIGPYTFDLALQIPLRQTVPDNFQRNFTSIVGFRRIL